MIVGDGGKLGALNEGLSPVGPHVRDQPDLPLTGPVCIFDLVTRPLPREEIFRCLFVYPSGVSPRAAWLCVAGRENLNFHDHGSLHFGLASAPGECLGELSRSCCPGSFSSVLSRTKQSRVLSNLASWSSRLIPHVFCLTPVSLRGAAEHRSYLLTILLSRVSSL